MKTFWEDYKDLCKQTGKFYKDHWKGVIVLNAVVIGAELVYFKIKNDRLNKEYAEQFEKYADIYGPKDEGHE